MKQQIIAMGGGGFSMEPENLLLDQYVLKATGKKRPKVCFVPTASGDSVDYVARFYKSMAELDCEPTDLQLYRLQRADLETFVMEQDVIYVGGGNTRNLIVLWKEWGLDLIFRKAWENGVVLAGLSAGMICWFEQGVTDSIPGELTHLDCLGFLPGSACPHYDGEEFRRPSYQRLMRAGMMDGYAADDGVALHFEGTELKRVVSSRPNAKGYYVTKESERVLETVYLGK